MFPVQTNMMCMAGDLIGRRTDGYSGPMDDNWTRFETRVNEMDDISSVIKLAHWDQEVMMPPEGGPSRARALATLQSIAHGKLVDPEFGALLDELGDDTSLAEHQRASVRIAKRDFDRATKVPEPLVREIAELEATAYQVWTKARPANDFAMLEPYLSKMISLKKEQADAIGWTGERYDALLDEFEPDMQAPEVEKMFTDLKESLLPVAEKILDAAGEQPDFISRTFDEKKQEDFSQWLVRALKFDTSAGRLDTSPHPFTMPVGPGDVRQTTRTEPNLIMGSIYASIHETGHALYEQNIPSEWHGLPVATVPSLGLHESQSRLWENQVGRSRPYCHFMAKELSSYFPEAMAGVDGEGFYRGANHPERSLIRVYADEVTYNLHVGLRFELELAMFRDELDVKDLPGAWNEAMQRWIGVQPSDDADGVMQDMHWSIGALGYFPTYTLGTLYAAALFAKAEEDMGSLDDDLAAGETERLLGWLKENVYSHGYLYSAKELAHKVLGEPITARPFIDYLSSKYADMYGLDL
jgi:carboxypeptidase Taq